MSRTFTVELRGPLPVSELLAVRAPGAIESNQPLGDVLEPGSFHHVFEPGVSTRALEVSLDGGSFSVRVLTGSCEATHALAFDLVERAAAIAGAGGAIDTEGLARAGVGAEVEQLAGLVVGMAEREDGLITLSGPCRPFLMGKRLAAELRAAGPTLGAALTARMRETQYADRDPGVFAASVLGVENKDGRKVRLAVWGWGSRYLLPDVAAVSVRDDATLHVPAGAVPEIADGRARYLDERHLLIEAFDESEWPAVVARARPHAVELMSLAR